MRLNCMSTLGYRAIYIETVGGGECTAKAVEAFATTKQVAVRSAAAAGYVNDTNRENNGRGEARGYIFFLK